MEALQKKCDLDKRELTRIKQQLTLHSITPITKNAVEFQIEALNKLTDKHSTNHEQMIIESKDEDEAEVFQVAFDEFINKICATRSMAQTILDSLTQTRDPPTDASSRANVKLPKLSIPTFSGDVLQWTSFSDLFDASVNKKDCLTPAQKLQYLRTSLSGEPLHLIQSLSISDSNYQIALDLLTARYANTRELVTAQLNQFFNQTSVQEESSVQLRALLDKTNEVIRSLKNMGREQQMGNDIFVYLIVQKLDPATRKAWELKYSSKEPGKLEDLLKFIEHRSVALQAVQPVQTSFQREKKFINKKQQSFGKPAHTKTVTSYTGSADQFKNGCSLCKEQHGIYFCDKFKQLTSDQKYDTLRKLFLCLNCLKPNHHAKQCNSRGCKICGRKHNTLLHQEKSISAQNKSQNSSTESQSEQSTTVSSHISNRAINVLLQTALIKVESPSGHKRLCRVLLDSASQTNFITEDCVKQLKLPIYKEHIQLTGIGAHKSETVKSSTEFQISSIYTDYSCKVEALVLPRITSEQPKMEFTTRQWSHIDGLELADPNFNIPQQIDLLLGAQIYNQLLMGEIKKDTDEVPIALRTKLGWVLSGSISPESVKAGGSRKSQVASHHADAQLHNELRRFWEQEDVSADAVMLKPEEQKVEDHFLQTYTRDESGKYTVKLAFTSEVELGDSKSQAIKRQLSMERRFERDHEFKEHYVQFMQEYEQMGHMTRVDPEQVDTTSKSYYIPHQAVLRPESETTKIRVVFDASSKSSNGKSLNDILAVGPKVQQDLDAVLIRWRFDRIAICGDIRKMFRCIDIAEQDRDYQRIVWRENASEPFQVYKLNTVTYGTCIAPFLASRTLKQLALEEEKVFPLASQVLLKNTYVDDLLTGANTIQESVKLQAEIEQLLARGGFSSHKWISSNSQVTEAIPVSQRSESRIWSQESTRKVLGIRWQPQTDEFSYKVNATDLKDCVTKRTVLSQIAQIYDPLGWISPVSVTLKIQLQQLWLQGKEWDQELSPVDKEKWLQYHQDLQDLQHIRIPRCVVPEQVLQAQLVGFADASTAGFAAVVYLRTLDANNICQVKLIAAKSKVAPIQQISVPRLELNAAVLLAKLVTRLQTIIKLEMHPPIVFSDSEIVLAWLRKHPSYWKTFVGNRVAKIQKANLSWCHVKSEDNPADVASRGCHPSELWCNSLWWSGPDWLKCDPIPSEFMKSVGNVEEVQENTSVLTLQTEIQEAHEVQLSSESIQFINRYSSLNKLTRVTSYVLRFITNIASKSGPYFSGPLNVQETDWTLMYLVRAVQAMEFKKEIKACTSQKNLDSTSKLLALNPFLDRLGILRVGGRLTQSGLSEDVKHQIILPAKHHLTTLIIEWYHLKSLHGGPQLMLSMIRQRFWLLQGIRSIKRVTRTCLICFKFRITTRKQLMADLPRNRTVPGKPFLISGVDYAGPVTLKARQGRGKTTYKGYIAVFTCFVTRATHLEAVSGLSTEDFITAFRRFVARRGRCSDLHSDQGTNFIGADRELKSLIQQAVIQSPNLADSLAKEGTTWHFNPPSSPHHGGIWESTVKLVKHHLNRTTKAVLLTFEDFSTVLCQIEACLNSRPITAMSSDPQDFEALTPGHFMVGEAIVSVPEPDLLDIPESRLSRYQKLQTLVQSFWKRWTSEYLHQHQARAKWRSREPNLQVGDLVVLVDPNVLPSKWNLARVEAVHPGVDGMVRVVTIKTSTGLYKRPIVKLAPLPANIYQEE